jgi:arginase family enzyme
VIARIRTTREGRVEINGTLWRWEVIEDMLDKAKAGEVRGFDLVELSPGVIEVCPVGKRTA